MLPPHTIALRHGLLMAAAFLGVGVALPFLAPFLADRGLTATEVAAVLFAGSAVRFLTGPPLGRMADALGDGRRVVMPCGALAAAGAALFLAADGFWGLLAAQVLFNLGIAGAVPLAEALWVAAARRHGLDYGRVRAGGSVAFIIAALASGWVAARSGYEVVPILLAASYGLTSLAAWWVPAAPRDDAAPVRRGGVFPLHLLRTPGFARLVLLSGLLQGSHGAYYGFGSIHWLAAGHSPGIVGLLWAEGVLAEIILFFWASRWFRGVSPRALVLIAAAAVAVRWCGTAATTELWALVGLQAMHAVTFGCAHLAAMRWIAERGPAGEGLSAQGLLTALGATAPTAAVTLLSGPLYETFGAGVFLVAAAMGVAAVPVALGWRAGRGVAPPQ